MDMDNGVDNGVEIWTVGVGVALGRRGQRGKNWDNCNRITIKNTSDKHRTSELSIDFS